VTPEVTGVLGPPAFERGEPVGGQPGRALGERGVDADDAAGETAREDRGDVAAPVPAVREERRVAEPVHQLHPRRGDLLGAPAGGGRLAAVTEPGQRRCDDVERRCPRIRRFGQFLDDVGEFRDAARPAVGHDQRGRVGARGPAVQEVDVQALDRRVELADAVEPVFEPAPVVTGAPVLDDVDQVGQRHALVPPAWPGRTRHRFRFRQPRRRQPGAQVVEVGVGGVGVERPHLARGSGHGSS